MLSIIDFLIHMFLRVFSIHLLYLQKEDILKFLIFKEVEEDDYKLYFNDLNNNLKYKVINILISNNYKEFDSKTYDEKVKKENKKLKKENKKLKKKQKEILNSKSWKITKPLRTMKKLMR